jgi:hypothetical protein
VVVAAALFIGMTRSALAIFEGQMVGFTFGARYLHFGLRIALFTAVYLTAGMITGVAFGAILLASAPAIVVLFALPMAWMAVVSLSFYADVAPWVSTARALSPMQEEVMSATQWAHVGTALALWMLLPLLIGTWRITRREVSV